MRAWLKSETWVVWLCINCRSDTFGLWDECPLETCLAVEKKKCWDNVRVLPHIWCVLFYVCQLSSLTPAEFKNKVRSGRKPTVMTSVIHLSWFIPTVRHPWISTTTAAQYVAIGAKHNTAWRDVTVCPVDVGRIHVYMRRTIRVKLR